MTSVVRLGELRLWTRIGVTAAERRRRRLVLVTVAFRYAAARAIATDDLAAAVDYEALAAALGRVAAARAYRLVETLAAALLTRVLAQPRVRWASVMVTKPGAVATAAARVEVSGRRPARQSG